MALVQDGRQEGGPNMARQRLRRGTPRSRLASRSGSVQPPVAHSIGQVALRPVQSSVSPQEAPPQPHSQVRSPFASSRAFFMPYAVMRLFLPNERKHTP